MFLKVARTVLRVVTVRDVPTFERFDPPDASQSPPAGVRPARPAVEVSLGKEENLVFECRRPAGSDRAQRGPGRVGQARGTL